MYDSPEFFAAYSRLERSVHGLDGAPEWPSVRALLPALRDGDTRVWPVDRYAEEGLRVTDWLAPGVRKFHRTLGTTVNALVDAGFTVRRLVEWAPAAEQVAAEPALAGERDRPMFPLVAADKPAGPDG